MRTFCCLVLLIIFTTTFCQALVVLPSVQSWRQQQPTRSTMTRRCSSAAFLPRMTAPGTPSEIDDEIRTYQHDGYTLKYRYKPASPGHEQDSPILLVHPVGIGLSSWFWDNIFANWVGGPLYAPDLIGCGIQHGADAWDPDVKGLTFPLGWAKGCEALFVCIRQNQQQLSTISWPGNWFSSTRTKAPQCTVVAQGGLAPVGLLMASRNPQLVSKLVLTSPPTWDEMTRAIPERELQSNYDFLRNPLWGKLAFFVLESRWAIEFFSNLFLFAQQSDPKWLHQACQEGSYPESRPPVMAFNAGFCNSRSFEEELRELAQPTLILQGQDDSARIPKRQQYAELMQDCTLQTIPGKNVLPWESPEEVCRALEEFI